jgi:iron uptake system component EfeO
VLFAARRPAAGIAALALAVAACGGSAASTTAPVAGSPGAGGPIGVDAKEFAFTPSTVAVEAGDVTFHVRNGGAVEHEFEILKGETVIDEIEGLVPGLERDLTVTLDPGEYIYVCRLPGHEEAGMKGTLTVTGS